MNMLNRYFRTSAKTLKIEIEINELNKQVRQLRKKQRKLFELQQKDDLAVRDMFNKGVFTNYGKMTDMFFKRLYK